MWNTEIHDIYIKRNLEVAENVKMIIFEDFLEYIYASFFFMCEHPA